MKDIVLYTTEICPYCVQAKALLDLQGLKYTEIRVDLDKERRDEMVALSGRKTVPQIFIGEQPIGGYTDLLSLHTQDRLKVLLT